MMKMLVTMTVFGALAIAPAVAQTNMHDKGKPSPSPTAQPPAKADTMKPAQSTPSPSDGGAKSTAAASSTIVSAQGPDQWLASSFKGTDVVGSDDKKVGDVSDLLFDQHGSIKAYIVTVGGFLRIGGKDIAIAPSSFQVVSGDKPDTKKLKLSMTEDQLKQAEAFKPLQRKPAPVTTGMAPGSKRKEAR